MNKQTSITGKIEFALKENFSKFGNGKNRFFIIKMKADDGTRYDIAPSSDCKTYEFWKDIVKNKMGKRFTGFYYLMTKKDGRRFLNKAILPKEVDEEEKKIDNQSNLL
jgi:hypothetical protein